MQWEMVETNGTLTLERMAIPNGWLVRQLVSQDGQVISVSLTFVSDMHHKWKI